MSEIHGKVLEYTLSDRPTRTTIDALRHTLAQVEEHSGIAPDDVCLRELKRILLNRIADLEAAEVAETANAQPLASIGLDPPYTPQDQPAVAVAVDLAITLLSDYLPVRDADPRPSPIPDPLRSRLSKNRR